MCHKKVNIGSLGFSLIELITVVAILGVIISILFPQFTSYKVKAEETICAKNRATLIRQYDLFLLTVPEGHSNFRQFIYDYPDEICPSNGTISSVEEKVICSIHNDIVNNEEDPPGEEVPWLRVNSFDSQKM